RSAAGRPAPRPPAGPGSTARRADPSKSSIAPIEILVLFDRTSACRVLQDAEESPYDLLRLPGTTRAGQPDVLSHVLRLERGRGLPPLWQGSVQGPWRLVGGAARVPLPHLRGRDRAAGASPPHVRGRWSVGVVFKGIDPLDPRFPSSSLCPLP